MTGAEPAAAQDSTERNAGPVDERRAADPAPVDLETHDFERWSLKFAVKWLRSLSESDRKKIASGNPLMLAPEELALDFKERILRHLHPAYHSDVEHRGHARMFSGGTYCLRQPVPKEKIIEAAQKAELIEA